MIALILAVTIDPMPAEPPIAVDPEAITQECPGPQWFAAQQWTCHTDSECRAEALTRFEFAGISARCADYLD
jgi:hypothetical protein